MPDKCEAHNRVPAADYRDDSACYGELWTCFNCGRTVCAGFGGADSLTSPDGRVLDTTNFCDTCWDGMRNLVARVTGILDVAP